MKNQYFGDKRDYFKWDFIEDLASVQAGRALCYVAMLTPPDGTAQGRLKEYAAGARRKELHQFLRKRLAEERRDVATMRDYFESRSIRYHPVGDTEARYYEHEHRDDYFTAITEQTLTDAIVFFDPDIGLNSGTDSYMRRVGIDKYLFDDDLTRIARRISSASIVVVYQHLQRDRDRVWGDIEDRCVRFSRALGTVGASFVTDRDVVFLVSSRDPASRLAAATAVVEHAHRHALECGELVVRG